MLRGHKEAEEEGIEVISAIRQSIVWFVQLTPVVSEARTGVTS